MSTRRLRNDEVRRIYGDPDGYVDDNGEVTSLWPAKILDEFLLPVPIPLSWGGVAKRVRCHRLVLPSLRSIIWEIYRNAPAWKSINDFGGCYQWRTARGTKILSRHSWGIAVDLDTKDNPFKRLVSNMHPFVVKTFEDNGWIWGGRWRWQRRDPQHFEVGIWQN